MKTLIARHKAGEHIGICSVCSAHPLVIEAALAFDRNSTRKVLIEATSNQVNQFGGYTGMTPADFREFVFTIADKVGFARERIILGGDHLGPNCWQQENADAAMEKSVELVKEYVRAGFSKIHLDASMSCAGPAIIKQAGTDYSPSGIANYTYDLAKEYNQFYHDYSILREENESVKAFRILLTRNVGKVIKTAMNILGIDVPERM